jgi:hypothetical protein
VKKSFTGCIGAMECGAVVSVRLLQRAVVRAAIEIDEALVMPAAPLPPAILDQHVLGRARS